MQPRPTIFPLSDTAITLTYGNIINEEINDAIISRFKQLRSLNLPWIIDIIPAYSSLTIHYDPIQVMQKKKEGQSVSHTVTSFIEEKLNVTSSLNHEQSELFRIPVSYNNEDGPDMDDVCTENNLTREELIRIHTGRIYKVYMLGFLPGFPYMGEVDERIASPRKSSPVRVKAGSVGIAGRQTGIYPLDSPGGWKIIGRTDLKLFDADKDPAVLLKPGDRVEFYKI